MVNIKKTVPFILLITLSGLHADTAGGEISLGFFNHQPNGNASYKGNAADMEETLGFSETQDIFLKVYGEHPLPLIPNIRLGYTTLSHEGSSRVNDLTWGNHTYNSTIESSLSLDMTDVTLYYELLDNWAETDAGLTFRYISGSMGVHSSGSSDVAAFSAWVPMLYGKVRFTLPVTDLSFQLEANAISYWDITAYDYELSARYTLAMGLGLEAGYKAFHLESDELLSGFDANADFSGPYVAAIWDF